MRTFVVGLIVLTVAGLGVGCGSKAITSPPKQPAASPAASVPPTGPSPSAADATGLYQTQCKECHALSKIEQYKGKETWEALVRRMIAQNGAKISPEDAKKIVEYLNRTYSRAQ